jgi:hypothetical protein
MLSCFLFYWQLLCHLSICPLFSFFAPHQSPLDVCSLVCFLKKIIGNSSVISRCLNSRVATMALIHAVGAEGDCATQLYSDLRHLVLWRDPLLTGHPPTPPPPPHTHTHTHTHGATSSSGATRFSQVIYIHTHTCVCVCVCVCVCRKLCGRACAQ